MKLSDIVTEGYHERAKVERALAGPDKVYSHARKLGHRFPAGEHMIANSNLALTYALNVVRGRWPAGEKKILKSQDQTLTYAKEALKRRWPEGEKVLLHPPTNKYVDHASLLKNYAKDVIKGKWPEAESIIATNGGAAFEYARDVLHGRFPAGEAAITSSWAGPAYADLVGRTSDVEQQFTKTPEKALEYAMHLIKKGQGINWPEGETVIATSADASYKYAKDVIGKRFPAGEPIIAADPTHAVTYAREVVMGPFPEGEKAIASNPVASYTYAEQVIKKRWPEGEPAIATSSNFSIKYAENVLQGRFPAGEPAILADTDYKKALEYVEEVIKGPWPEAEKRVFSYKNAYASQQYRHVLKKLGVYTPRKK